MSLEIDIACGKHSAALDGTMIGPTAYVDTCEECIDEAREKGFEEGRLEGYNAGFDKAKEEG